MNIPLDTSFIGGVLCFLFCAVCIQVRVDAARRHRLRMTQLERANEFLQKHGRALELLLESPEAPTVLKDLILAVSDMMEDEAAVLDFVQTSEPHLGESDYSIGSSAVDEAVRELCRQAPKIGKAYFEAMVYGPYGAILRWPASAKLYAATIPSSMFDNELEIHTAIECSKRREDKVRKPEPARHLEPQPC